MRLCEDCGWVCENHPHKPWEGEHACNCGARWCPVPVVQSESCRAPATDAGWVRPEGPTSLAIGVGRANSMIRSCSLALLWHFRLRDICKEDVTVRTSSGWRSCEEVEDRLPDGRHAWLWWRS